MQPEMHAGPRTRVAHPRRARRIETGEGVGAGIELNIDVAHTVFRRPGYRVLELQLAADIDSDAIEQGFRHGLAPSFNLPRTLLMRRRVNRRSGDRQARCVTVARGYRPERSAVASDRVHHGCERNARHAVVRAALG